MSSNINWELRIKESIWKEVKKFPLSDQTPAYDDKDSDYSMADFIIPKDLSMLEKQGGKVFIYGSEDDPVVPSIDFKKYKKILKTAIMRKFSDRGHFNQEVLPELIKDIKSLYKK